ncbi:sodium:proton antiporter [Xylophilus rhododendri]|uniref:Sodium:proton antiporter n=1 Tax=Xylophilus rhododendri TaxID=2697032 RepID=A0A857J2M5_9BURK|nr:sodium:proton antiporter [Xylophilus rhododendri]QHI98006.1 sodium:proton antiporter [Xylophilus rhododendri]
MPTSSLSRALWPAAVLAALLPTSSQAAALDGAALSPLWALPFAGLLLSIALLPLIAPAFWHHHFGKIAAAWALLFAVPCALVFGGGAIAQTVVHALLAEYLPFIVLLTALYTVAGGIFVRGNLHGSAALNTGLLAIGAALASLMGTTGAAMLLLRPLLRANDDRARQAHVVIFFIFIVANAGGALTPLGDPPLFLGFLQGVDFFWMLRHILTETLFLVLALLAVFFLVDRWFWRRDGVRPRDPTADTPRLRFEGLVNLPLLLAIVGLVLMSGFWKGSPVFDILGTPVSLAAALRDLGLVAVTLISLAVTPKQVHHDNGFAWAPMAEVAKLFAGIFLTIAPVIAMLQAGANGPFGAVVAAVTRADGTPAPAMYFWITGLLSAFLDNAPTYLVFFHTAGGDPQALMTALAPVLAAISTGAVFMGALSYIGNAPNLMVKAIAEHQGVAMPGFFGYMAWSCAVLLPLFALITLVWF